MISIITSCVKRELYIKRLVDSIRQVGGYDQVEFEFFIIFQGAAPSAKLKEYLYSQPFGHNIKIGQTETVEPIGAILATTLVKAKYPIIFKIDDDCTLLSMDFLPRAYELCQKMPRGVIYPWLVDGEIPPMDKTPSKRQTIFLERNNVHITVGESTFLSGKYLIPTDLAKNIPFQQNNDVQLIKVATLQHHLPIFLTLNGLVLENQEGYSGQHHRAEMLNGQTW